MNVRSKVGQPTTIKLYKQEQTILESSQGLLGAIGRMADGEIAKAAKLACENVKAVRTLLELKDTPEV